MSRLLKTFRIEIDPDTEPLAFRLEFANVRTGEVETHDFEAVADPGFGGTLAALAALGTRDGMTGYDVAGLRRFFERVLLPDSYERLSEILDHRNDLSISANQLADVYGVLLGEYSNRPTSPPPASSGGRRNGGTSSTGRPSSKAST